MTADLKTTSRLSWQKPPVCRGRPPSTFALCDARSSVFRRRRLKMRVTASNACRQRPRNASSASTTNATPRSPTSRSSRSTFVHRTARLAHRSRQPPCGVRARLRSPAFGLDELAVDQALGDLHGVERRTLAQIVGYDPHLQAIFDRSILANAADVSRIFAYTFVRGDVATIFALIDDKTARSIAQDLACFVRGDRLFELDIDGLGVADKNRHANAGRAEPDLGIENLLGLDHHLPLFFGVPVFHEDVDVRNHVERNPLRKLLRFHFVERKYRLALREELIHRLL